MSNAGAAAALFTRASSTSETRSIGLRRRFRCSWSANAPALPDQDHISGLACAPFLRALLALQAQEGEGYFRILSGKVGDQPFVPIDEPAAIQKTQPVCRRCLVHEPPAFRCRSPLRFHILPFRFHVTISAGPSTRRLALLIGGRLRQRPPFSTSRAPQFV